MIEKIMTLHPDKDKTGVNIDRKKYEMIKTAILEILTSLGEISFNGLSRAVEDRLPDFNGSVMWYVTSVKLDLEARNLIERIPDERPQKLRLVK